MEQKIIIPKTGIFRVYRNELQIDPETTLLEKLNEGYGTRYKKPFDLFSNNKHYIMQIPKTVNKVNYTSSHFWETMNIVGTLEIQSHCPIEIRHNGSFIQDEYSTPITKWKNVIFNCPETSVSFQLTERSDDDSENKNQASFLESVTVNSHNASVYLENLSNVSRIEINSKNATRLHLQCPNLQKLSMPNMQHLQITDHKYASGFNLFGLVNDYYDPDNKHKKDEYNIPDDCLITLNKNLKISSSGSLSTIIKSLNKDISVKNITALDIFDNKKPQTLKLNSDETFTVSAWEFRKCFAEYIVNQILTTAKSAQKKLDEKYKNKQVTSNINKIK